MFKDTIDLPFDFSSTFICLSYVFNRTLPKSEKIISNSFRVIRHVVLRSLYFSTVKPFQNGRVNIRRIITVYLSFIPPLFTFVLRTFLFPNFIYLSYEKLLVRPQVRTPLVNSVCNYNHNILKSNDLNIMKSSTMRLNIILHNLCDLFSCGIITRFPSLVRVSL